jgi:hypothetical protein
VQARQPLLQHLPRQQLLHSVWETFTCHLCLRFLLLLPQAMMELGATVCKPVNPSCSSCPVSSCCAAYKLVAAHAAAGGAADVEDAPRVTDYPEKVRCLFVFIT